jgi:hypothetical protein
MPLLAKFQSRLTTNLRRQIFARIQEGHKFLLHTICELVDEQLLAVE